MRRGADALIRAAPLRLGRTFLLRFFRPYGKIIYS